MKRVILSIIKVLSFSVLLVSSILFFMTFTNQSYFIDKWEDYLKDKLNERIELLDDKIDNKILWDDKVKWILDKVNLTDKIKDLKDKWKDIIQDKTEDIVEKAFKWDIENMKDIQIFWKSLKIEVKSIISNFILDIRIFLLTNIIWFGLIYLLMFLKSRIDIIRNMFSSIMVIFLIMILWIIYYIIWQDWITNIVTNNFLWYSYPVLIIVLISLFIYFFNKNVNNVDKKLIEEAKTWKFYWSIKDLKEPNSTKTIKWLALFVYIIIELILQILFIPFNL